MDDTTRHAHGPRRLAVDPAQVGGMVMSKPVPCGMCGGSGFSRLCPAKTCQRCSGSGVDPYASR